MPPPPTPIPIPGASGRPSASIAAAAAAAAGASNADPQLMRPGRLVARAPRRRGATDDSEPSELRRLVLDYMLHSCFVDSAVSFAKDQVPASSSVGASRGRQADGKAEGSNGRSAEAIGASEGRKLPGAVGRAEGLGVPMKTQVVERSVHFDTEEAAHDEDPDAMQIEPELATNGGNGVNGATTTARLVPDGLPDVNGADVEEGYPDLSGREIRIVRLRSAIREHIATGRIKEAISMIEAHFPAVLDSGMAATPGGIVDPQARGSTSRSSSVSRLSRPSSRTAFTPTPVNLLRPLSGPNPRSPLLGAAKSTKSIASSSVGGVLSDRPHAMFASLEPAHIALNMQTQAFIEFVRSTAGGASAPTASSANGFLGPTTTTGDRPGTPGFSASPKRPLTDLAASTGSLDGGGSPAASIASSSGGSAVSQKTAALALSLSYCQALWRRAGSLPDPGERVVFLKELESVSALLSYADPWESPAKRYMDQSRRDVLAERVNAAILVSLGRPATPVLELAAQQTTFTWDTLSELEVKLNVGLPAGAAKSSSTRPVPDQVCPSFDLADFVDGPVVADDRPPQGIRAL